MLVASIREADLRTFQASSESQLNPWRNNTIDGCASFQRTFRCFRCACPRPPSAHISTETTSQHRPTRPASIHNQMRPGERFENLSLTFPRQIWYGNASEREKPCKIRIPSWTTGTVSVLLAVHDRGIRHQHPTSHPSKLPLNSQHSPQKRRHEKKGEASGSIVHLQFVLVHERSLLWYHTVPFVLHSIS